MRRDDLPIRHYQVTCQSGNSSGLVVPVHTIGYLEEMQIDTAAISGAVQPAATIIVRDFFLVSSGTTGGVTTVVNRKQVSIGCGDDVHVDLEGVPLMGTVELRSNVSGPVVSLGVAFEM